MAGRVLDRTEILRGSHRYLGVLLLVLASFLFTAFAPATSWSRGVLLLIESATLTTALWTSRSGGLRWRLVLVWIAVVLAALQIELDARGLDASVSAVSGAFVVATMVVVARGVLSAPEINGQTILGAISIYVLVGMLFSFIYSAAARLDDGPFFSQGTDGTPAIRRLLQLRHADHGGLRRLQPGRQLRPHGRERRGPARTALPRDRHRPAREPDDAEASRPAGPVSTEAIVLAVASAIRPSTSLAALYALLRSPRPRRLLLAFIVAGLAWTTLIGILVISVFQGVTPARHESDARDVVELVAGSALLGFALGIRSGRIQGGHRTRPAGEESAVVRSLHHPSLRVAATAGVLTHLPGIVYFVALTAIAEGSPPSRQVLLEVLIYNVIWFSLPIAAGLYAGRRPDEARDLMGRVEAWGRRHRRTLAMALSAVLGAYLMVQGAAGLSG